jgi:hypothetical protein
MTNIIVIGPHNIADWLKLQNMDKQPCNCEKKKDLTTGLGDVRNIYCPTCGAHEYGGVKLNKEQWNRWVNSEVVAKMRDGKITVHTNSKGFDIEPKEVSFDAFLEMIKK